MVDLYAEVKKAQNESNQRTNTRRRRRRRRVKDVHLVAEMNGVGWLMDDLSLVDFAWSWSL